MWFHYEVLGVPFTATYPEVRSAYVRRSELLMCKKDSREFDRVQVFYFTLRFSLSFKLVVFHSPLFSSFVFAGGWECFDGPYTACRVRCPAKSTIPHGCQLAYQSSSPTGFPRVCFLWPLYTPLLYVRHHPPTCCFLSCVLRTQRHPPSLSPASACRFSSRFSRSYSFAV